MLQEFVQEIKNLVKESLKGIHTACPGKIVSVDALTGLATVTPCMKFKLPNGKTIDYPQITGVPIVIPQAMGQNATIAYPIKPNDGCILIFSEQSIDYWMYGQTTDTDLSFDLTNAICIPGLFPNTNNLVKEANQNNSIIIDVKGTRLSIKESEIAVTGNLKINGNVNINGNFTTSGGIVNLN